MPCLHVAIVYTNSSSRPSSFSSGSGSSGISYDHHAIFDRRNNEYIHVSSPEENGEFEVVRTGRRSFETSSSEFRVVKQPASVQEALEIVQRAGAKVGETWEYSLLSRNCEHFVNECWKPEEPPQSNQAQIAAGSIGVPGMLGAVGAGAGTTIIAATPVATVVTSPWYFLGFIPWGTTSATVMTGLPAVAVIGIAAGGTLLGGGLVAGAAYGIRELVFDHTARNAQLIPIAVKNNSDSTITASLRNGDWTFSSLFDALYAWRALIGVGVMSLKIDSGMAEELNPPTVTESSATEEFVLTVSTDSQELELPVSRGDVVTFDGERFRKEEVDPLLCTICMDRRATVILEPCKHWDFCEECIMEVICGDNMCPLCRRVIEYMID